MACVSGGERDGVGKKEKEKRCYAKGEGWIRGQKEKKAGMGIWCLEQKRYREQGVGIDTYFQASMSERVRWWDTGVLGGWGGGMTSALFVFSFFCFLAGLGRR